MGVLSVTQRGQMNGLGNLVTLLLFEEALSCMDITLALVGTLINFVHFFGDNIWKRPLELCCPIWQLRAICRFKSNCKLIN